MWSYEMKIKSTASFTIVALLFTIYSSCSLAANDAFVGIGVGYQDQDEDNSVNLSFTAGLDFYERAFQESSFQRLTLGLEIQYSQSISGTDETKNYSIFGVAKFYTAEQYYLKLKQGVTNFPDAEITDSDAEHSHIGVGVGLGYKLNNGAIEVEYVYANKTLHASVFAINYKYRF